MFSIPSSEDIQVFRPQPQILEEISFLRKLASLKDTTALENYTFQIL